MEKDQKNIDQLFHRNLDGAGEQPPAFIWDNIAEALDDADATKRIGKLTRRSYYGIALLLMMIIGATVLLLQTATKETADTKALVVVPKRIEKMTPANINPVTPEQQQDHIIHSQAQEGMIAEAIQDASLPVQNAQETIAYVAEPLKNASTENQLYIPEPIQAKFVKQETIATETTRPLVKPVYEALENNNAVHKTTAVQTRRNSRFSLSVFFAPDITTRNLEQNIANSKDEGKEEMALTEKNGILDFTFGGRVEYQLNKHISFLSGLSFSTNTIDIARKMVYARYDKKDGALKYRFNMSSGYSFFRPKKVPPPTSLGDSTEVISSTSTLHYVNIPLAMKYNFPSGRFNFFMQAGITARFITKQSISAVYAFNGEKEKSTANQINGLKTSYFNGSVGIGAEYSVNTRLAITFSPTFNFATSSINHDAPVKAYPNTLSIATGLKWRL